MDTKKSIDVLNTLLEINNDRIQGYDIASKETEESDLQSLFFRCIQTSQKCKGELISEIDSLGGEPEEGTKTTGKIYRIWMDFKAAVTGKDRKAILNSCEFGEDVAVGTYEKALKNDLDDLSAEQISLVRAQYALIKADHDTVRNLRDQVEQSA